MKPIKDPEESTPTSDHGENRILKSTAYHTVNGFLTSYRSCGFVPYINRGFRIILLEKEGENSQKSG